LNRKFVPWSSLKNGLTVSRTQHSSKCETKWKLHPFVVISSFQAEPNLLATNFLWKCNPTHKTESGTANRWETINSKPPGRTAQKHLAAVRSYVFYQPPQRLQFCWSKPACFDFSSSNFTLHDQVRSTAGDALRDIVENLKYSDWGYLNPFFKKKGCFGKISARVVDMIIEWWIWGIQDITYVAMY
jgi:hypothetical protein